MLRLNDIIGTDVEGMAEEGTVCSMGVGLLLQCCQLQRTPECLMPGAMQGGVSGCVGEVMLTMLMILKLGQVLMKV